jgi:hypothetical protein
MTDPLITALLSRDRWFRIVPCAGLRGWRCWVASIFVGLVGYAAVWLVGYVLSYWQIYYIYYMVS